METFKWEDDVVPQLGPTPQAVVDAQTPNYDIYLGILAYRFGTPTGPYGSGTEAEFRDARNNWGTIGKPWILFYFRDGSVNPMTLDLEQLSRVRQFRQEVEQNGLHASYDSIRGHKTAFFEKVELHLRNIIPLISQAPEKPEDRDPRQDRFLYTGAASARDKHLVEEAGSDARQDRKTRLQELEQTCFVMMPFGRKEVGGKMVDFDAIYAKIFNPAIEAVETPEGQPLIVARTDMDAFSGSLNQEMFEYLMYSRLAVADISSFNPNVFYDIGVRHGAQEWGTVLFRQTGHALPFDIVSIKVFEYDHQLENAEKSRSFITSVLSETLKRNRLDSPTRIALRAQWKGQQITKEETASKALSRDMAGSAEVASLMQSGAQAIALQDFDVAKKYYEEVRRLEPDNQNALMWLGWTLVHQDKRDEAIGVLRDILKIMTKGKFSP